MYTGWEPDLRTAAPSHVINKSDDVDTLARDAEPCLDVKAMGHSHSTRVGCKGLLRTSPVVVFLCEIMTRLHFSFSPADSSKVKPFVEGRNVCSEKGWTDFWQVQVGREFDCRFVSFEITF